MHSSLEGLNEQQKEAVTTTHGPVLILAGAGSGKTRALTHRIAYLMEQSIAKPSEILAVTFTNKAAGEMRHRIGKLLGDTSKTPDAISTFHSLGVRILRETAMYHDRSKNFTVVDAKDSERLVRAALKRLNVSLKLHTPHAIKNAISIAKNNGVSMQEYAEAAQSETARVTADTWPLYEAALKANDAYDFDDLLLVPVRVLETNPAIATAYQARWKWIHVDEYQDTNDIQETLLRLLLGTSQHICVVGDDYQAIYSWRGARVDHILEFEHRYPNCKIIHLTQNYRSTPQILDAAGHVIAGNSRQKHKQLWTQNGQGAAVHILEQAADRDESSFVRAALQTHAREGGRLQDWAILYRTNAQSRMLEEEFLRARIPYTIVGGFRFYERREVKDALALLQWLTAPDSYLPLERLAEALLPRVGPRTLQKWQEGAQKAGIPLREYLQTISSNPQLTKLLAAYKGVPENGPVSDTLRHLLVRSGYMDVLKLDPEHEERLENIEELANVTSAYTNISDFLQETALMTDIDSRTYQGDRVTCMTLHAAKGLEFNNVCIIGCEEELMPHINSVDDNEKLEEERRLLYVGMTRARKQLVITFARTRYQAGQLMLRMPSRFLDGLQTTEQTQGAEMFEDTHTVYANQGEVLHHPVFGQGVVISVSGNSLTCVFEGHGVRTISGSEISL